MDAQSPDPGCPVQVLMDPNCFSHLGGPDFEKAGCSYSAYLVIAIKDVLICARCMCHSIPHRAVRLVQHVIRKVTSAGHKALQGCGRHVKPFLATERFPLSSTGSHSSWRMHTTSGAGHHQRPGKACTINSWRYDRAVLAIRPTCSSRRVQRAPHRHARSHMLLL